MPEAELGSPKLTEIRSGILAGDKFCTLDHDPVEPLAMAARRRPFPGSPAGRFWQTHWKLGREVAEIGR
jgi:hypothetical protein